MELFVKKFIDCFDEDLQQIIKEAEKSIYFDNICINGSETNIKRVEGEILSESEYKIKYGWSTREKDIKSNKSVIERCKERIAKNENKLSFYHNMNKILSILK